MNNRRLISIVFNILPFWSLSYAGKHDVTSLIASTKSHSLNNKRLGISNSNDWEVRHFVCLICQDLEREFIYKSRKGLVSHFEKVHKLLSCYTHACTCDRTFNNEESLKRHCERCNAERLKKHCEIRGGIHKNRFVAEVFLPMTLEDRERIKKRKQGVSQKEVRKKRPVVECSNKTIEQTSMANAMAQLRKTMDAAEELLCLSPEDKK